MKKKNRLPRHNPKRKGKAIRQLPDIDPKIILGAFIGAMIADGKITIEFESDETENIIGTDPDDGPKTPQP